MNPKEYLQGDQPPTPTSLRSRQPSTLAPSTEMN